MRKERIYIRSFRTEGILQSVHPCLSCIDDLLEIKELWPLCLIFRPPVSAVCSAETKYIRINNLQVAKQRMCRILKLIFAQKIFQMTYDGWRKEPFFVTSSSSSSSLLSHYHLHPFFVDGWIKRRRLGWSMILFKRFLYSIADKESNVSHNALARTNSHSSSGKLNGNKHLIIHSLSFYSSLMIATCILQYW